MKLKLAIVMIVTAGMLTATEVPLEKASPKVQALLQQNHLKVVDTPYVQQRASLTGEKATVLIDARPNKKYRAGHLPGALSIPDSKFDDYFGQIQSLDRGREMITYCGGWKCIKSPKLAAMLTAKGFKNVKVYQAGFPAWKKAGLPVESQKRIKKEENPYIVVDGIQLVKDQEENKNMVYGPWYLELIKSLPPEYQLVDVRDAESYQSGHIPGAINIPFDDKHAKAFVQKLSGLGKKVIMNCASGATATEAITAVIDEGGDLSRIFYVDANVDCDKENRCTIEINDPL